MRCLCVLLAIFCMLTVANACHRRCRDEIDEELIPHFSSCLANETGDNITDFTQLVTFVVYYDVWYQAIASSKCPYPSSFFALSESDTHFCWIIQLPSLLPYGTKYYEPLKQCIFLFSTIRDKQRGGGPALTPCHVSSVSAVRAGGITKQRTHDTCPTMNYVPCMRKHFKLKYKGRDGKPARYDMDLIKDFVVNIRTDKCTITKKFMDSDKPYIVQCPDSVKPPRPGHLGSPFTMRPNKQAESDCFAQVLPFVLNSYEPAFIRAANACGKIYAQKANDRKRRQKERLEQKKREREEQNAGS